MSRVQQLLAMAVALMSLLVGIGKYYNDKREAIRSQTQHEADEAQQRRRDRDHIRQLERIVISEFPQWTAAISWDDQ